MSGVGRIAALVASALVLFFAMPARAADICDGAARFDTPEIAALREWIALAVPVDEVAHAKALRIEVAPAGSEFGPYVELEGESPVLVVPEGFRARHCRMVLARWLLDGHEDAAFRPTFQACFRKRRDVEQCVDAGLDALWPAVNAKVAALEEADRDTTIGIVELAFQALVLHEFAHMRQSRFTNRIDPALDPGRAEFEADLYASFFGSILNGVGVTMAYNFGLLEAIQDFLPAPDSPHDSFTCRAHDALFIGARFGIPVIRILAWPHRPDPHGRGQLATFARGEDQLVNFGRTCNDRPIDLTDTVADMRKLADFQNSVIDSLDQDSVETGMRIIKALIDLPLHSEYGEFVRFRLVASYARFFPFPASPRDMAKLISMIGLEKNRRYFIAFDFGYMLRQQAVAAIHALPANEPPGTDHPAIHALFDRADYYHPGDGSTYMWRGILYYFEDKCTAALTELRRALPGSSEQRRTEILSPLTEKTERKQAAGDCRP